MKTKEISIPTPIVNCAVHHDQRPFYIFLLVISLHGLLSRLVGFFLPLYFKDLGFSGVQIGFYFTIAGIATLILSLPMGVSTDRKSISTIFMLSAILTSLSYTGLITTQSYGIICIFALVGSFGNRFYSIASASMFFKISRSHDSSDAGWFQLVSAFSAGIGMVIGSILIAKFSFHWVFISACVGNILLFWLSSFLPKTQSVCIGFAEYRKEIFNRKVLFVTAVFTLGSLHWGAETVAYAPFLKHELGLSMQKVGLYTGTCTMMVGVGAVLGSYLLKRKFISSIKVLMMAGFVLGGVFHILMTIEIPWVSYICRILHEVGDGFVFLAYYYGIAKIFHIDKIGGCSAFISLCMGIGSMGSALFFGWLGESFGYGWPLVISGIIMVCIPVSLHLNEHHFALRE